MDYQTMRALEDIMEFISASTGLLINILSYVIAGALSGTILSYGIRWFIFRKAGEKGWKAIIPFYSDYINYKIAWDGRIYLAIVAGMVASAILGTVCGWISVGFGAFVSIVCSVILTGAQAITGMILQFKMARAFGRNDYFAVGLYFLGSIFSAILAFGDSKYQGPQNDDGFGVPKVVENLGNRASAAASAAANAAAQQLQRQAQQRAQQPQQPQQPMQQQPQQPVQQYQPMQQNYNPYAAQPQSYQAAPQQGYPQMPQQAYPQMQDPQQRTRRSRSDQFSQ